MARSAEVLLTILHAGRWPRLLARPARRPPPRADRLPASPTDSAGARDNEARSNSISRSHGKNAQLLPHRHASRCRAGKSRCRLGAPRASDAWARGSRTRRNQLRYSYAELLAERLSDDPEIRELTDPTDGARRACRGGRVIRSRARGELSTRRNGVAPVDSRRALRYSASSPLKLRPLVADPTIPTCRPRQTRKLMQSSH